MTRPFNAFFRDETYFKTGKDLQSWIADLISALYPDNGVEYWSNNRGMRLEDGFILEKTELQPIFNGKERDAICTIACYHCHGSNEGRRIHVGFVTRGNKLIHVAWAKIFEQADVLGKMTNDLTEALEAIVQCDEIPAIVDYYRLVKADSWNRESKVAQPILIEHTDSTFTVRDSNNVAVAAYDHADKGDYSKHYIEAILSDWKLVLSNLKLDFSVADKTTQKA